MAAAAHEPNDVQAETLALKGRRQAPSEASPREARLRRIVNENFEAAWRFARRLGIPECDVDDVVQDVIWIAARRLDDIQSGSERAFVMATTYRVASDARRARARRNEVTDDVLTDVPDEQRRPDDLMGQRQARELLDRVLAAMPLDLRAVFVLYELDGFTMAEIAESLELSPGTVASRLRRGREQFDARVERLSARWNGGAR